MTATPPMHDRAPGIRGRALGMLGMTLGLIAFTGCASYSGPETSPEAIPPATAVRPLTVTPPSPDPRVGLGAGLFDAEEAVWNLNVLSRTAPAEAFVGVTNSDLAFSGDYAIQGNYNGVQVWDISNPSSPTLAASHLCPASQSDVSVYKNLLFVSGEGLGGRLDCGTEGVSEAVSHDRLRGIRIFDIADMQNPKYIANVQTCRGSHTHTVLEDPNDHENVYIYVSGSAPVRPSEELEGCSGAQPSDDPNSALFRIEVIRVPLANPAAAAIVSSPRIFNDLVAPASHGLAPADQAAIDEAKARGAFVAQIGSQQMVLPNRFIAPQLDSIVAARGGSGAPTAADSTALREYLPTLISVMMGGRSAGDDDGPKPGPTQCHDITVYPEIGLAGGACEGYGLLLDISDPVMPRRMAAVADSNFAYWHSATFNNDGTQILFSDEWGGGGGPKCRATDPSEWGADAIFTIEDGRMEFKSYFKMSAAQTPFENCVAHNGSLIPVPGRDVMVQAWYQGGISVFDWTDPSRVVEIAFYDRGPIDDTQMAMGGSWSVYWYNGVIVSSEIARGLDIFELAPSDVMSQNEIDAAKTVKLDHLNSQGQPKFVWPNTFSLARAYVDQLERSRGLMSDRVGAVRSALDAAEQGSGSSRRSTLNTLAGTLDRDAVGSADGAKVRMLAEAVRGLASGM
jgi:LVIVD repeat